MKPFRSLARHISAVLATAIPSALGLIMTAVGSGAGWVLIAAGGAAGLWLLIAEDES